MTKCNITIDSGALAVKTPYDSDFVMDLKITVPAADRRYKGDAKAWLVSPKYGGAVQNLCQKYFGETPKLPTMLNIDPIAKQSILDCRYIGMTKSRGGDERTAFGWSNGGWNVVFPENVLRAWFDAPTTPSEATTLYSVLGIKRDATEGEVKSGYRRMALQWHPDRCKEPNAADQFIAIQHAYEVLSNDNKRERYDAGLKLEASLHGAKSAVDVSKFADGYRAPLRCGLIMVEGIESMGIFTVSKIYAWQDITDQYGRVLVVSWPRGADHFQEVWA